VIEQDHQDPDPAHAIEATDETEPGSFGNVR